ncbi:ABC transporter permease subunit [Gracilibacillus salitolerans]|uniref:ABC transporter permease subunit n=2 Tax=Gracilibacillus salitolerans TaxID=2663022 RepID=A0A5Q2TPZ0_9BACI|nr:ABC transporter permease subunit [Gracilibacillus salitolerans]
MISTSIKPNVQLFTYPPVLIPNPLEWQHYFDATTMIPFFTYFKNSLLYSGLSTLGVVVSCPIVAYSLARLEWRGRDTLFILTLAVMMIPFPVTMVPLFLLFSQLGLVGGLLPLILPLWFGMPFFIFLLRQFFKQLPSSLEDAARIDGCSEFGIFFKIMLPICQPAILTIALFQFMFSWNDFLGPLIYLSDPSKYTLQIGLQQFQQTESTAWGPLMAASVLIAVPIIVLYFFVQKAFVQGISLGSVKG